MASVSDTSHRSALPLYGLLVVVAAGLVVYSQTAAFAWDEGFHILVAQLIRHGKRPYLDFVFSQTPLNACWNALWMAVLGETWRVPHLIAALCASGAVVLTATYVLSRFPVPGWQLPGAILVTILVGMNVLVVRYGGIAQAYGLCLLSVTAAYRLAILTVDRRNLLTAVLTGFFCGLAAGSSLLTAPVGPVILLWIVIANRVGSRASKIVAFLAGGATAFLPIFNLLAHGPRQVYFGIIDYNLLYRQADWPDATQQNLEVLASWIDSGHAVLLILTAVGGFLFVRFRSQWDARVKAEFDLCGWLSLTIFVYISTVRPTFARYYICAVPFLGILAVAGISAAGAALYKPGRPWAPVALTAFLMTFGLGKTLYDERDAGAWSDMEQVARKVTEVTPPGEPLFADEETYFLTQHTPPSGMEMQNSHKFNFSRADRDLFHLMPQTELDRRVATGYFATLETCEDSDYIGAHGFAKVYTKSSEVADCTVFWDRRVPAAGSGSLQP